MAGTTDDDDTNGPRPIRDPRTGELVDNDDRGGMLENIFSPETARTIKRAAPFVALGLLALLVLRN